MTTTTGTWTPIMLYGAPVILNNQILSLGNEGASLLDNLLAHYKLDETSGTLYNSVPNSSDLTDTANASLGYTGKIGNGVYFDASTNYIRTANIGDLGLGGRDAVAFSLWLKADASSWDLKYNFRFIQQYQIIQLSNENYDATHNRFHVGAFNDDASNYYSAHHQDIIVGQWEHYVVNVSDKGPIEIYRNGVIGTYYTNTFYGVFATPGTPLNIGGINGVYSRPTAMKGVIDEVGIWSRPLSQIEVSTLYNNGNGKTYPFL